MRDQVTKGEEERCSKGEEIRNTRMERGNEAETRRKGDESGDRLNERKG